MMSQAGEMKINISLLNTRRFTTGASVTLKSYKSYVQKDRVLKNIYDSRLRDRSSNVKVFPVNFGSMHGEMLFHLNTLLSSRKIRIRPCFPKLITSLRTAQVMNDKWSLDKEQTSYNDILDSFRLSLLNYYFTKRD